MVCRHMPPAPGCQRGPGAMATQTRQLGPSLSRVRRMKEGGVLDACIDAVGVRKRGLQILDALELPWVRRAVVQLMRAGIAVGKLTASGDIRRVGGRPRCPNPRRRRRGPG